MKNKEPNLFVISWDNLGVEAIIPVTTALQDDVFNAIKTGKSNALKDINHTVGMMMLRARYNQQRHYEIYTLLADRGITVEDLKKQFEMAPQEMADLVRERGTKLYSDRLKPSNCKIT